MTALTDDHHEPGDELANAVEQLAEHFDPVPESVIGAAKAAFAQRAVDDAHGANDDEPPRDRAEQDVIEAYNLAR
jgi:hypothetical protein